MSTYTKDQLEMFAGIINWAKDNGLPPAMLLMLGRVESSFRTEVKDTASNSYGVFQINVDAHQVKVSEVTGKNGYLKAMDIMKYRWSKTLEIIIHGTWSTYPWSKSALSMANKALEPFGIKVSEGHGVSMWNPAAFARVFHSLSQWATPQAPKNYEQAIAEALKICKDVGGLDQQAALSSKLLTLPTGTVSSATPGQAKSITDHMTEWSANAAKYLHPNLMLDPVGSTAFHGLFGFAGTTVNIDSKLGTHYADTNIVQVNGSPTANDVGTTAAPVPGSWTERLKPVKYVEKMCRRCALASVINAITNSDRFNATSVELASGVTVLLNKYTGIQWKEFSLKSGAWSKDQWDYVKQTLDAGCPVIVEAGPGPTSGGTGKGLSDSQQHYAVIKSMSSTGALDLIDSAYGNRRLGQSDSFTTRRLDECQPARDGTGKNLWVPVDLDIVKQKIGGK